MTKAQSPIVDNRRSFGRAVSSMTLPMRARPWESGEAFAHSTEVMFCQTESGYAHDKEHAEKFLVPGYVYRTSAMIVNSSSSQVELQDFPGVWFNTVMFIDWSDRAGPPTSS